MRTQMSVLGERHRASKQYGMHSVRLTRWVSIFVVCKAKNGLIDS